MGSRFRIVSPAEAKMKSQLTALGWLVVAMGIAVGFEGGRPWFFWQYWDEALPMFCFRAMFIVGWTLVVGTTMGATGKAARASAGPCRTNAFWVSIGLAVLGSLLVELPWPPFRSLVSIWFPMVLFSPRIAQKLAVPGLGFWDEPHKVATV